MTTPTPGALLLELVDQQARLTRNLDQALSLHGISFTEFAVLRQLHGAPQQRMRRIDLAHRIHLTASGVTRLLDPMAKIGLVAKEASERDARVSLVILTEVGQRLLTEAEVSFELFADQALQAFDKQDRGEFARLIRTVR